MGVNDKPPLASLAGYFVKLGTLGFGGPIALTGAMQSDLVDERAWFTQETFQQGMTLSQLAPGPLAAQLAIYLGWAHSGVLGATVIGLAFILPSFLMVVALAALYLHFGQLPLIQRLFHGIGPAVIAIICLGARKLAKKNVGRDPLLWGIALANALVTALTQSELVWAFLACGVLAALVRYRRKAAAPLSVLPPFLLAGLHGPATGGTLATLFGFFLKSGSFVFGSGLAIVPFLRGGVVAEHHWLTDAQFLDAVAVAMITPGPVVITVGFIGFLLAGLAGACVAALGTFLPCYLLTVIPAPYFSRVTRNEILRGFVGGVTAAAVGAILGAVIVLGRRSIVDVPTAAVFAVALLGMLYLKKVPEPAWIVLAGLAGLAM